MKDVLSQLEAQKEATLKWLCDLVSIPGVSFPEFDHSHLLRSAESVAEMMEWAGLQEIETLSIASTHPAVIGRISSSHAKAPTLLLYAHHDVQPPMREAIWNSPPFEPTIRDGRLFGRGSADDKAGIVVHLASIRASVQACGSPPVNLVVLVEGEEEIGSPNLTPFLERYQHKLQADAVVVMDLQNFESGVPTLTTSLRGMVCGEITLSCCRQPLHSGLWGGPVPDPAMGLSRLMAGLVDRDGQIAIEGLLDGLLPPSKEERASWEALDYNESTFREQTGMLPGVETIAPKIDLCEKLWRRPSFSINAFEAGSRANAGNVVLDSAWCRFGLRIAPGMDPENCRKRLEEHLRAHLPWGLQMELHFEAAVGAWCTDPHHPFTGVLLNTLSEGYQENSIMTGCGATIPLADPLSKGLGGVPVFLVGIEDPQSQAHSENESMLISDLFKAIESQCRFFEGLSTLQGSTIPVE